MLVGTTSIETSELLSGAAQAERHRARGAERQAARARGAHRRAGRHARARSRSRPTWPAAAPTSCSAATSKPSSSSCRDAGEPRLDEVTPRARAEWQTRHDAGGGRRRPAHRRHRAPRVAPHRQPAARPLGPPGRSGLEPLLSVARRQPDAHLRRSGAHQALAGTTAGMKEGEVIESGMLSRQIENAQRKVEAHNFDVRKNLLEYDDVANDQRKVIYQQRTELMARRGHRRRRRAASAPKSSTTSSTRYVPPRQRRGAMGPRRPRRRRIERDFARAARTRGAGSRPTTTLDEDGAARAHRRARSRPPTTQKVRAGRRAGHAAPREGDHAAAARQHWREHLAAMDYLRQGIHLRGYAQKNPKQEYKREAFELFTAMLDRIKYDTVTMLHARLQVAQRGRDRARGRRAPAHGSSARLQVQHAAPPQLAAQVPPASRRPQAEPQPAAEARRRRCRAAPQRPCARAARSAATSRARAVGKKFKHCHGALRAPEARLPEDGELSSRNSCRRRRARSTPQAAC